MALAVPSSPLCIAACSGAALHAPLTGWSLAEGVSSPLGRKTLSISFEMREFPVHFQVEEGLAEEEVHDPEWLPDHLSQHGRAGASITFMAHAQKWWAEKACGIQSLPGELCR